MSSLNTTKIPEIHSEAILREMFRVVGKEYDGFDFTQPNWYLAHEWSDQDQDNFISWLADYLFENKLFKKRLYRNIPENLYRARQLVANYGWKCKLTTHT